MFPRICLRFARPRLFHVHQPVVSPRLVSLSFCLLGCWHALGTPRRHPASRCARAILVLLTAVKGEIGWMRVIAWMGLVGGAFAGGAALAFLADRSRHFASQNDFFSASPPPSR